MGRDKNPSFIKGADLPANNFNWDEANGFIKRLNIRFKADRAALPTEAEWEYACRAGTRTPYIWGAESEAVNLHAWHEGNSGGELKSVAQKKANGWGLYDMAGNAWEWCADAPRQYKDKIVDPFGSVKDRGDRCVRGGSALEHPHLTRSGNRHGCNAGERFKNVGLRVVMH
jgi:formylglycine-generating enzyme required for sulfatase activity